MPTANRSWKALEMRITPDQVQDAGDYALTVRNVSTRALAQLDAPANLDLAKVATARSTG